MFSLDATYRYWLYSKPVDMRKSFNGLGGIVTNAMGDKLRSGDTARKLIGGYSGAVQTDGYEVYAGFERWMDSVANNFSPKSRMAKALVYTYALLPANWAVTNRQ